MILLFYLLCIVNVCCKICTDNEDILTRFEQLEQSLREAKELVTQQKNQLDALLSKTPGRLEGTNTTIIFYVLLSFDCTCW